MGRAPRQLGAGATYHVTARGNAKMRIFTNADDRTRFLTILSAVAEKYGWTGWSYCLMGNHVHLCFTTRDANLSHGMRDLLGGYARAYNRTHGRTDHLFGRRFHAVHVTDDGQLMATIRYIAQNPVRAGLVARAEEWQWGSYRALIAHPSQGVDAGFVDVPGVLALFHHRATHARAMLRATVTVDLPSAAPAHKPGAGVQALCAALLPADAARTALARGHPPAQVAAALGIDRSTLWRRRTGGTAAGRRPAKAGA